MEENKKSKKGLIVCIIIIIALIIALCVVYYWGFIKDDNKKSEEKDQNIETQIETDDTEKNQNNDVESKESFKVAYTTETLEELTVGEAKYVCTGKIPSITGIDEKVANKMEKYLTKVYEEFAKSVYEMYSEDEIKEILENMPGGSIGFNQTYEVILQNEKVVTFKYILTGNLGGVSWDTTTGVTFDITTGEVIDIIDIVTDEEEYIRICKEYVLEELEKDERFSELDEGYEETVNIRVENLNGYLTEEGIVCVEIEKYEISNGAAGEFRFTVPYELVEDCIDSDYIF